jgi:hypothetical protein
MGPDNTPLTIRADPVTGIEVTEAAAGSACGVIADGVDTSWADWWFIPHAHEWGKDSVRLRAAAREAIGLHPDEQGFNDRLHYARQAIGVGAYQGDVWHPKC